MFCVKNEDVNYQIDDGENNMNTLKEGERILVIQLFVTDSQSQTWILAGRGFLIRMDIVELKIPHFFLANYIEHKMKFLFFEIISIANILEL